MEEIFVPDYVERYYELSKLQYALREKQRNLSKVLKEIENDVQKWMINHCLTEHHHKILNMKMIMKEHIKKETINKQNIQFYLKDVFQKIYDKRLSIEEIELLAKNICLYIWSSRKNETFVKLSVNLT